MNDKYNELISKLTKAEENFIEAIEEAFKPFLNAIQSEISVGDEVYYKSDKTRICDSDEMIVIKDYGERCRAYSINRMTSFTFDKVNLCKTGKHYDSIPFPKDEDEGEARQ